MEPDMTGINDALLRPKVAKGLERVGCAGTDSVMMFGSPPASAGTPAERLECSCHSGELSRCAAVLGLGIPDSDHDVAIA